MQRGLDDAVELWVLLPVQLKRELKLPGVVSSGGLARTAGAADGRIAQLVHGQDVRAVKQVEYVSDQVQTKALAEVDALGHAHVELEETRHREGIAAEVTYAAVGRGYARNGECGAVGQQAGGSLSKGHAVNVR